MIGEDLARACNLPATYATASWGKVCKSAAGTLKSLDNAVKVLHHGVGFYFWGDYGRGKSALAALVLMRWVEQGKAAYWIRHAEIPSIYIDRPVYDPLYTLDVYIERVPLLVIDEFQIRSEIRYQETQLEELIRRRVDRKLPCILTTNVVPDEVAKRFPALKSVLGACMCPVVFSGDDMRRGEAVRVAKEYDVS